MFPFLSDILAALLPLLSPTHSPHEDVRSATLAAMPDVVLAANKATARGMGSGGRAYLTQLLFAVVGAMLEALGAEDELDLVTTGIQCLTKVIEHGCFTGASAIGTQAAGVSSTAALTEDPLGDAVSAASAAPAGAGAAAASAAVAAPQMPDADKRFEPQLSDAQLTAASEAMVKLLKDNFQRRAVRRAQRTVAAADGEGGEDEEDEDEAEAADEDAAELAFYISEFLGMLAKTHGAAFLPTFKRVLIEPLLTMAHENCLPADRKIAVFVFDDVLENSGAAGAAELLPHLMPVLLQAAAAHDVDVRRAACFGLGVAAVAARGGRPAGMGAFVDESLPASPVHAGASRPGGAGTATAFSLHLRAAVSALVAWVKPADARSEENEHATDNAVASIGKILDSVDLGDATLPPADRATLLSVWLAYLPMKADDVESGASIALLCSFLESPAHCSSILTVEDSTGAGKSGLSQVLRVFADVLAQRLADSAAQRRIRAILQRMQADVPAPVLQAAWGALGAAQQSALIAGAS